MESEFNVDVVIKTPYLDVGDQQYKCNLNWTVRILKNYLSNVYPTKPTIENQRLIYFGQVLSDDLVLKNIFMNEFKVQTIHMMCPPKHNSKETLVSNNLKSNNETSKTTNINSDNANTDNFHMQGELRTMTQTPPYIQGYTVNPIYNNQQIAMMQQAYAHYMMQYFQYIESNRLNTENSPTQSELPPPPSAVTNTSEIQPEQNIDENAPNIPVNEINEDPLANRDFLDFLYILIRFSILLSILYFYSSFRRCLFVIGITFFIYVYRRGFFTIRRGRERNRNDRRQQNPPRRNMIRNRRNRTRANNEPNSNQQGVQNNQVTTVKTFIASFFTSLIPEQLNPVDIN